jgi:2-oxoglutarate ferredoxin oxidoreductase subunit beta
VNTFGWYKDRVYSIDDEEDYDPKNRNMAFERAQEWGERIPTGLLYRTDRPTRDGKERAIRDGSLVRQSIVTASFHKLLEPYT